MHAARDYSDVTSRVIDEEVERILREQEARASRLLQRAPPRPGRGGGGPARKGDHRRRRGRPARRRGLRPAGARERPMVPRFAEIDR